MKLIKNSGLFLPKEEAKKINKKEAMDIYYSMHSLCPNCGQDGVERTCVGYWFYDIKTFKDENRAMCSCGWRGIVHELQPVKEKDVN